MDGLKAETGNSSGLFCDYLNISVPLILQNFDFGSGRDYLLLKLLELDIHLERRIPFLRIKLVQFLFQILAIVP